MIVPSSLYSTNANTEPFTTKSKAEVSQFDRSSTVGRGAFIVLEGVDRCGKTTQCGRLMKRLLSMSITATALRFPNRDTVIGKLINDYLQSKESNVDDRAIHLLFSANRWEAVSDLADTLSNGTTIICDRYAYSGVAFSSAKKESNLSIDWCKGPDVGLIAPDAVIYLDLDQEEAELRGGYGAERYEKKDLQIRVRQRFKELTEMDKDTNTAWHVVDASKNMDQVETQIFSIVQSVLDKVAKGKPLNQLWSEEEFPLN